MKSTRQLREEMRIKQKCMWKRQLLQDNIEKECESNRVHIKKDVVIQIRDKKKKPPQKNNDQGTTNVWQVPQGFHQDIS